MHELKLRRISVDDSSVRMSVGKVLLEEHVVPCARPVLHRHAFRAGEHPTPARFDPTIYRTPTTTDVTQWLRTARFTDIHVERRPHNPAIAVPGAPWPPPVQTPVMSHSS